MNVNPTAKIFFLECDSDNNNDSNNVNTNKLQGLKPSTIAIKNVNNGKGKLKPTCCNVFGEIFFKNINIKIITINTNVDI